MEHFNLDQFNPQKNYAIEASAGSGKTFSVVAIVIKLLQAGIPLNKILIVTYTEKATGELKNRVREEIEKANIPNINIDDNAIYTIHGFCKKTIDEFSILIKSSTNLNLVDDQDAISFINRLVRDDDELKKVLKNYDASMISRFIKKIASGMSSYYLKSDGSEDSSIITLDQKLINKGSAESEAEVYLNNPLLRGYLDALKASNIDRCINFASDVEQSLHDSDGLISFNGSRYQERYFDDPYREMFIYIREIKDYQKEVSPDVVLANRLLPKIYLAWQKEKQARNYQDFGDMLRTVREALILGESPLKIALQEKYQYGIIDEFQDTNQIQWDIFSHIFLEDDAHHLVVVGDPKQSIFSFQGTDVSVYKSAVSKMEKGGALKQNLPYNWRSTKNMIEACNQIFSDEFFKDPDIKFIPSSSPDSNTKKTYFDGQTCKPIWISNDLPAVGFAEAAVQKIIECTSVQNGKTRLQIEEKGVLRNVSYHDFVILYRSRSEAENIERTLKWYGLPYVKYKDNSLFTSSECKEWLILLKAIITPDLTGKNITYFKEALFTKFFNKSLYEISDQDLLQHNELELAKINRWKMLASHNQYEDLFDDIIIESNMINRMANSTKIDSFNKFRQIGDVAIAYLMDNHSLDELVDYLVLKANQASVDEEEDSDNELVARNTDFDTVRLMTIHASKGLEFPVVICVSGSHNLIDSYNTFTARDENNNKKLFYKIKIQNNSIFRQQELMRLYYVALTRASHLLILPQYTDAAKSSLSLFQAYRDFISNKENEKYYQLFTCSLTFKECQEEVNKTFKFLGLSKTPQTKELDDKIVSRLKDVTQAIEENKTYKHSYSSLTHAHEEVIYGDELNVNKEGSSEASTVIFDENPKWFKNLLYDEAKAPITLDDKYPKGAGIGTALHEVMEKCDFVSKSEESLTKLITQVMSYYGYAKPEWLTDTFKMVQNVLAAKLPVINGNSFDDQYFALSSIENKDKLAEVEFNFNKEEEFLKNYFNGFIDLIIRRGERLMVLDWKSDTLNDEEFDSYAKAESLKNHVDSRYAIQRVLYSYVLIKWLKTYYKESEEEIFQKHFGGVFYVFLRGCQKGTSNGIYAQTWDSYASLKKEYDRIIKMIGGSNS